MLGDTGVGKTSIAKVGRYIYTPLNIFRYWGVQVFCENQVLCGYSRPSSQRTVHNVTLMLDTNIVHCALIDIPAVRNIPKVRH